MSLKRLHNHLIPHKGNGYKPLLFTASGVAVVVTFLLLLQAAQYVQTRVVLTQTDFLAAVLPGVLIELANEDRSDENLGTLIEDPLLAEAARRKAEDMAARGYFAHVDPDGRQPWYWLNQVGYRYSYAGENLAVNFTDSKAVERAWMNSPTHRANILKPEYTRIGIGTAEGEYKGKKTMFVVQYFATPRTTATPAPRVAQAAVSAQEASPETQVLGVEVGTVVEEDGTRHQEDLTPNLETAEEVQTSMTSIEPTTAGDFFARIATSPTSTLIYVLAGIGALLALLLLIAIGAHWRVRFIEVTSAGLVMLLVVLALLVFNATEGDEVLVPEGVQPAAATVAI